MSRIPDRMFRLAGSVAVAARGSALVLRSPRYQMIITSPGSGTRQVFAELALAAVAESRIDDIILDTDGLNALAAFHAHMFWLARHGMLHVQAGAAGHGVLATLIPISSGFGLHRTCIEPDRPYRLSRFAYQHRARDGYSYWESPLSHARIRLDRPEAAMLLEQMGHGGTPDALARATPGVDHGEVASLVALLVMARLAAPVLDSQDPAGARLAEDDDEMLAQWDFHDLLFHSRSRLGRHGDPMGGTMRWRRRIAPQPAVKLPQGRPTIALPRPDIDHRCRIDPSLASVMEARASVRTHGRHPITRDELGEFLYRLARVKQRYRTGRGQQEVTTRPYPSGGASYELELYLTVDRCQGVAPGLYWYDPCRHALELFRAPCEDTNMLLADACAATGGACRPQVLITLAARFQRVSWKYEGIAYALVLKHVGVLYALMYLVATAMDLAPCALGAGDSDRFARVTGLDYLQEGSVGEFALGSGPARFIRNQAMPGMAKEES